MKTKLQLLAEPRLIHETILVDETISKFGYDPRRLKEGSCKPVVKRFSCCGLVADRNFRYASKQHSCQRCANKDRSIASAADRSKRVHEYWKTHRHPRLGAHLSEEAKERIRKASAGRTPSQETRDKIRVTSTGRPCPQKALDYWKNPAHLGVNHHNYGRKPTHAYKIWYTMINGNRICFRSTWEARVARYLDGLDIHWEYETKMFSVSYEWNNVTKYSTYRSDFWLPHKGLFIEVKGLWREEYAIKFRAFQEQYPAVLVEVWDKTILIQKGIRTGHIIQGEFDEGDIRRNRHDARAE